MQPELFSTDPAFDGATFDPALDQDRLSKQLGRVWAALSTGAWLTLAEIAAKTGDREAGISARIRDLRKPKFGGYDVQRRRRGDPADGLFEYRVTR